jgi:hypothetical protein
MVRDIAMQAEFSIISVGITGAGENLSPGQRFVSPRDHGVVGHAHHHLRHGCHHHVHGHGHLHHNIHRMFVQCIFDTGCKFVNGYVTLDGGDRVRHRLLFSPRICGLN